MDTELTRIYLGGALGNKFGHEWNLYVSSPSEAIKAINVNTGGKLREYLSKQGQKKFYKVSLGNKRNSISRAELGNRSGTRDIYILPTVKGANSGFGKIIAGIVIIAVAYFSGGFGAGFGGSTFASQIAIGVVYAGVGMVLGGIVQLLTPSQNTNANQDATATAGSNIFQGNATAVFQGLPVALVYGRALVSPLPVSIAFSNFDQSPNFGGSDGGGGSDNNPGGGGGGGGTLNSGGFDGGTYFPYTPTTDPGTGVVSYTQSTIPVVVRPVSY